MCSEQQWARVAVARYREQWQLAWRGEHMVAGNQFFPCCNVDAPVAIDCWCFSTLVQAKHFPFANQRWNGNLDVRKKKTTKCAINHSLQCEIHIQINTYIYDCKWLLYWFSDNAQHTAEQNAPKHLSMDGNMKMIAALPSSRIPHTSPKKRKKGAPAISGRRFMCRNFRVTTTTRKNHKWPNGRQNTFSHFTNRVQGKVQLRWSHL